jgi:hypothetical protein
LNNGTPNNNKKKRRKIPKIVAYLSLLRWSHALRSDQNSAHANGGPRSLVCLRLLIPCKVWNIIL